jgi:hypothetical protein
VFWKEGFVQVNAPPDRAPLLRSTFCAVPLPHFPIVLAPCPRFSPIALLCLSTTADLLGTPFLYSRTSSGPPFSLLGPPLDLKRPLFFSTSELQLPVSTGFMIPPPFFTPAPAPRRFRWPRAWPGKRVRSHSVPTASVSQGDRRGGAAFSASRGGIG